MTSRRYAHAGPLYDLLSFERLLYRRPRERLLAMLGPLPGATVVDVGCGTGRNLGGLRELVGPHGRIIGIDASTSMLRRARRRAKAAGWANVRLVEGHAENLLAALTGAGSPVDDPENADNVDVIIATFVLSIVDDQRAFWTAVDHLGTARPLRVALADLGAATRASTLTRLALDQLVRLGGSDLHARPWEQLAARSNDVAHEIEHGGHVHLAVGSVGPLA
ncbi:MAG: methyltransferase domain-containing protein [Ilumatobacteraceae bacterium]